MLEDDWNDENLQSVVAANPGVGTDADLAEVDRFRAAISRLVAKALDRVDEATSTQGPSVFLWSPTGPATDLREQCKRVPMLDQGREPIDGRVWFVTHVATSGLWLPASFSDDDELFRFVTDEVGAGDVPAILLDPRPPGPQLRFYPCGLAAEENVESLQIALRPVSLEVIFEHIDAVYRNQLVTPGVNPRGMRLWADTNAGVASSQTEDTISALLAAGLHTALPNCRVRVEQPMPTGRLDIEIEERMPDRPGGVVRHAILELKVLRGRNPNRSRVSPRRTKTIVEDGIAQAASYRLDKDALASALCCFDMRPDFTGSECFSHVKDLANENNVELRNWHLFMSAAAYRRHLQTSGALARTPAASQ